MSRRSDREYMAVVRYPQGDMSGWTMEVLWKGERRQTLGAARIEGTRHCDGSDDFNIAFVRGDRLEAWTWMGDTINEDADELAVIAEQLGLAGVQS